MSGLPVLQNGSPADDEDKARDNSCALVVSAEQQLVAVKEVGKALTTIATWLTSPDGLAKLLSQHVEATTRTGAIKEILGGLAAHDGRNALDPRVMNQNAVEVFHHVEAMMDKMKEGLKEKYSDKPKDPNLHDAEDDYSKWKSRCLKNQR